MAGPVSRTDDLRAFCEVAASGSFTAAAETLGASVSSVSKQVRALEAALGVRLFHRTTRRVSLTEAGETFHEHARDILEQLLAAEAAAGALQEVPRGRLRATLPMDFGRVHLAPLLATFAERYPEVALEVDLADRQVDLVEEGFDVAVRIGHPTDSGLIARRLGTSRMALVAAPDYLARRGEPALPADLAGHDCLVYTLGNTRTWELGGTPTPVRAHHRANNGETIRELTAAGCGVALLPTFLVGDDLRSGRLRMLMRDQRPRPLAIQALYSDRRAMTAKLRAFIDLLAEGCGAVPPWDAGLPLD
jgi:DNA-binding transcriptional LysR family regulator